MDRLWSDTLVGFVSGLLSSSALWVAALLWRRARRDLGERPIAAIRGRRAVKKADRIDDAQPWSAIALEDRRRVALGCVYLILLDQYRESDEPGCYHAHHHAWGWGDSQRRIFGEALSDETDPARQASPGLTALTLDVLGKVWADDCRERPRFLRYGVQYLCNHQAEDGGINWFPTKGAGLDRVQVTGSLRHAASGSVALHRLACGSSMLGNNAQSAFEFLKVRWGEKDVASWGDTPDDFRPLTAGAIRRAVWHSARNTNHPHSKWSKEFIGRGDDVRLTRAVWEMVENDDGPLWRGRTSWDYVASPETYPSRPVGTDNLPDSTLAFLVWSPLTDTNCHQLVARVVDAAQARRTPDGGVQLYGSSHGELGSAASLACLLLSPELRANLGAHEWRERYGAISIELFSWAVEHFWDAVIQRSAGLPAWLWLLEALLYDQDVREFMVAVDPFELDKTVERLRGGAPRLYRATPADVVAEVAALVDGEAR